jgi:hypothetical protein
MISLPGIALRGSLPAHNFQFAFNSRNAILNTAAVRFQLRFTFTTAHSNAAFLPGQMAPEARQSRKQMLQLRQFNLQFALFRAGALRKNVKDQRRAIQDFAVEYPFQIAALGGRKFVVEDHRVDIRAAAMLGEFVGLAFANESRRARRNHTLQAISDDLPARSSGQLGKFLQ